MKPDEVLRNYAFESDNAIDEDNFCKIADYIVLLQQELHERGAPVLPSCDELTPPHCVLADAVDSEVGDPHAELSFLRSVCAALEREGTPEFLDRDRGMLHAYRKLQDQAADRIALQQEGK